MTHAGTPTDVYLVCDTCRLGLALGNSTARHDATIAPITLDEQPAWLNDALNLAVWRLLTEHVDHDLRVLTRAAHHFDKYRAIPLALVRADGPPRSHDFCVSSVPHAEYIDGWPSSPIFPHYLGATPRPSVHPPFNDAGETTAYLACIPCRLEVQLGHARKLPDSTITPIARNADPAATLSVWRLLTDHAGHDLRTLIDESYTYDNYMMTGEWLCGVYPSPAHIHDAGQLTYHQYTDGWPDQPAHARYLGVEPVIRRPCARGGQSHVGCATAPPTDRKHSTSRRPSTVASRR